MFDLYDFILSLWWHSVYLLYIVLIMMTLFCSLGPRGDEGVAERPPVWGVLYSVCTGRLRHAYHLPHDTSGTVQCTHPTVPLLTSPTPSPSNSHPTKSFPNDTPGTVQHPHSVQHSLPHLSLTPFNIPSSTHLPLQPHPTILIMTPQVQFDFLTPPHPMVTCPSSTTRCHRMQLLHNMTCVTLTPCTYHAMFWSYDLISPCSLSVFHCQCDL